MRFSISLQVLYMKIGHSMTVRIDLKIVITDKNPFVKNCHREE